MTYVFLALHSLMRLRIRLKKKAPTLTLPLTRRLLASVLPLKSLTVSGAMQIVRYHLKRNLVAYTSHRNGE
jgi:hypothetical protein